MKRVWIYSFTIGGSFLGVLLCQWMTDSIDGRHLLLDMMICIPVTIITAESLLYWQRRREEKQKHAND